MVQYRGIDRESVISSLADAAAFAAALNTGPEVRKDLEPWLNVAAGKEFAALRAAKTDQEFVDAMRGTRASGTFLFLYKLYKYHASVNTRGEGRRIYAGLVQWGAFSGARHAAYTAQDAEIETHIRRNKLLNPVNAAKSLADEFLCASGKGTASIQSPFNQYGLVDKTSWSKKAFDRANSDSVAANVEKTLDPYRELDEVKMVGIGIITDSLDEKTERKKGIVFHSTLRVAQAVAAAHPEREVIDWKGNRIGPKP